MKILFLTPNLNRIGGIERYNRNLIQILNKLRAGVQTVELRKSAFSSKIVFLVQAFVEALFLRPDVVFCGHLNFSPLVYLLKKTLGFDYVVFAHGTEAWSVKSKLKIKALKSAKIASAVSKYTAGKLKEQIPELAQKIFLLPNTIDGNEFFKKEKSSKLLLKHGLSAKDKLILTVARLSSAERYKGYDTVIKSLPLVIKEIPNAKYVLVGGGDDASRVKKLIKNLNLEGSVAMTGETAPDELVDYYNLCDVFVMPSKGEGFGIVFLEALACGKPVIAGNAAGAREAVLDGETGILVNPYDTKKIANAIINVLKKKVRPELLDGDYLRKKTLEAYGFHRFKEKVRDLLSKL